MQNSVFKKIELVGTSNDSISAAIDNAIGAAGESLQHVSWFEVEEIRGHVENGKVTSYQVVVKVGFRVDR